MTSPSSSNQFQRGRPRTRYRYLPITLKPVEEIEGKGSPNENSESVNEGSSSYSGAPKTEEVSRHTSISSHSDGPPGHSDSTGKAQDSSRTSSESPAHRLGLDNRSRSKSVGEQQWTNLRAVMAWYARLRRLKRSKSNQRWMKLRTTVQLSGAITSNVQKKSTLKREDSFLKRFSTRQVPEAQETFEIGDEDGGGGGSQSKFRRSKKRSLPRTVVNPDGNFYFYWLFLLTICVLYNLWTLIVRESFPELQAEFRAFWITADAFTDIVIFFDLGVQFRTGYLEQGLMIYKTQKLAKHYVGSKHFWFDVTSLVPSDFFQLYFGTHPMFRVPRFLKTYRMYNYYYMVESRTVYPNVWRVVNLIHILLLLAHWFGCFYYLISEAEGFDGPWVYPHPDKHPSYAPLTRKYLGSLYWSTLTLTTIGDLPTPFSNWQLGDRSVPFDSTSYGGYRNHSHKSRLLHIHSNTGYLFTIVSYLIGVFIFATIVGQVGNVITNRNANRLEFERLLDGAKMYMRHHRVPRDMQRRVLRWYDYSWSRGRIQGGGDINTALGLLPDKLKTELALHVNLSVLKKVTIFQECQPEFLHDLVLKMKAYIFTPGDLICRKGEVAREMFIIADGILEVISETGRVLTTMQAGDFFGEIGILNLDGLNKRTADVRSVGYAELFSLSREDVLAAMKDYPEAQEILQTLGRKRLMEARKANAPVKKPPEKKSPMTLPGQGIVTSKGPPSIGSGGPGGEESGGGESGSGPNGDTPGKRIVEKLRSDVKGLRNAIRKSRKSNSSKEDSSEPESTKEMKYDPSAPTASKSRKESTASVSGGGGGTPIVGSMIPSSAAGRGVLKRMHNVVLSDETEKVGLGGDVTMSNLSPTILPRRVHVQLPETGSSSKSSSQKQEKQEVIGAGLPLIQRLRLLKQKEDLELQSTEDEKPILLSRKISDPQNIDQSHPSSILSGSVSAKTDKTVFQTKVSIEPPPRHQQRKIRKLSDILLPPQSPSLTSTFTKMSMPSDASNGGIIPLSPLSRSSSPNDSTIPTSSDSNTSEIEILKGNDTVDLGTSAGLHPSRPSALRFQKRDPKTYGSVDDLSPEFSRLPFIKKLKILNERQKIAELLTTKSTQIMLKRSTSEGSSEIPLPPETSENMYSVLLGRRTQSSSEPYAPVILTQHTRRDQQQPPFPLPLPSPSSSSSPPSSPEGQPKPKSESRAEDSRKPSLPDDEPIRIPAESNITTGFLSTSKDVATGSGQLPPLSILPQTSSLGPDTQETSLIPDQSHSSPPYSPNESNETPERRHLKSILKTLAKSGKEGETEIYVLDDTPIQPVLEDSQLLKEPTIAGYAARHRKFAKNVTFQRQAVTVVSPEEQGPVNELGVVQIPRTSPGMGQERHDGGAVVKELQKTLEALGQLDSGSLLPPETVRVSLPIELVMTGVKNTNEPTTFKFPEGGSDAGVTTPASSPLLLDESIGTVFLGIKQIIQTRMEEFQLRFQDKFTSLEKEVRQRDEIISFLQVRLQELEDKGLIPSASPIIGRRNSITGTGALGPSSHGSLRLLQNHQDVGDGYDEDEENEDEDDDEDDNRLGERGKVHHHHHRRRHHHPQPSQASFFFSRGDSIDTVIDNTEVFDDDDEVFTRGSEDIRAFQSSSDVQTKINSQWTVAERESIEMTEVTGSGIPMWQLEFHREASPRVNLDTEDSKSESVAVDIGNTSTEFESTSSSSDEDRKNSSKCWVSGVRHLKEIPIRLDGESGDESEDDGSVELEPSDSSSDECLDNTNWEVQMLAKELTKLEEREEIEASEMENLVVEEMLELDSEIQEMRDVVNSGRLSPGDLDMLESMLDCRTERVQALCKAYSVDESRHLLPSSSSAHTLSKSIGRVSTDFQPRTSIQYTPLPLSHRRISKQFSPGSDEKELDPYHFRKTPNVRRQSSLCETSFPAKLSSTSTYLSKRRESAGSIGLHKSVVTTGTTSSVSTSTSGKSFFSKFNFIRSLSRTFLFQSEAGTSQTMGDQRSTTQTLPESSESKLGQSHEIIKPSESVPVEILPGPSTEMSHKGSSSAPTGMLPLISTTLSSALSSSVKSDPGTCQSSTDLDQPIFPIPSTSTHPESSTSHLEHPLAGSSPSNDPSNILLPSSSSQSRSSGTGECQPLLKK